MSHYNIFLDSICCPYIEQITAFIIYSLGTDGSRSLTQLKASKKFSFRRWNTIKLRRASGKHSVRGERTVRAFSPFENTTRLCLKRSLSVKTLPPSYNYCKDFKASSAAFPEYSQNWFVAFKLTPITEVGCLFKKLDKISKETSQ